MIMDAVSQEQLNNSNVTVTGKGSAPTLKNTLAEQLVHLKGEGYNVQDETPTPDTPIHINAWGDKGYFDGDLVFTSGTPNKVTNKNPLPPLKNGDVIKVQYEDVVTNQIQIEWVNEAGTKGSYNSGSSDTLTFTMYEDVTEWYFSILDQNLNSVADAKHICVTINGQYVLRVKTGNKNLCPYNQLECTNSAGGFILQEKEIYLKANKTYVLQCDSATSTSNKNFEFVFKNSNGDRISKVSNPTSLANNVITITPTEDMTYVSLWVNEVVTITNFQIHEGTTRQPYEPHQETEALIPVSSPLYDGDYIDVYVDGSGREYRENAVWYLSDTLGWSNVYGTSNSAYYCNIPSSIKDNIKLAVSGGSPDAKCNIAVADTWANVKTKTGTFCLSYDGDCGFHYDGTLEEFKESYTQSNAYIVYKLKEPTITPLTAEQVQAFKQLYTYEEVTNVTSDGVARLVVTGYQNNADGKLVNSLEKIIEANKESLTEDIEGVDFDVRNLRFEITNMLSNMSSNMFVITSESYDTGTHTLYNFGDTVKQEIALTNILENYTPVAIVDFDVSWLGVNSVRFNDDKTGVIIEGQMITSVYNNEVMTNMSTNITCDFNILWVKNEFI